MAHHIGFMGMGGMGVPMAINLRRAGYPVTVYNRTAERCKPLLDEGARLASAPGGLAETADVVILMLTGPEAIEAVLGGAQGAVGALGPTKTLINMSTVSPAYAAGLAEQIRATGARFLDAPVSGSIEPAENGTLVILAGGEPETVDAMEPLLSCMGRTIVRCGPVPGGSMMKMSVNLLLGVVCEGLAEALQFGEMGGLSREAVLEAVMAGPLANGLFQSKAPMFRDERYSPRFPAKHMVKDLKFVLDTAHETGAAAPGAHAAYQAYRKLAAMGLGDEDFAAVIKAL